MRSNNPFKIILLSVTGTAAIIIVVASMFLNGILGWFGYISLPVETFNQLKESSAIIEKMKTRHKSKKLQLSKKFVKRSSKKIASSVVAAATIGTAAVAVTVAGLEVYDYCADQKSLFEEEKMLFKTNTEFNYQRCIRDAKKDSGKMIHAVKEAVPEIVGQAWDRSKNFSHETWQSTKQMSTKAWKSVNTATETLWGTLKGWVK